MVKMEVVEPVLPTAQQLVVLKGGYREYFLFVAKCLWITPYFGYHRKICNEN